MKAYAYSKTGPAEEVFQIQEVHLPEPGPGEICVRMQWTGVNPSDVKTRSGHIPSAIPFPRVPHSDGSGYIESVGTGVSNFKPGDRVWVWNAAWGRSLGTAAEFVILPQAQAQPLPDNCPLEVGACLGIPAMTACHTVVSNGGVSGQTVLVAGGAGAVGHYAIQAAKYAGAQTVIATVSAPEKAKLAEEAGADIVVNYRTDDLVAAINEVTGGRGVDRIIEVDVAKNVATDVSLLCEGGVVLAYGSSSKEVVVPFSASIARNITYCFFIAYKLSDTARREAQKLLYSMLQSEKMIHNIALKLTLDDIVKAHQLVESGQVAGNIVLEVN